MTGDEIIIARALNKCTFLPGSAHKRFARNMDALADHDPTRELTEKQKQYLLQLRFRYRRQIPTDVPGL